MNRNTSVNMIGPLGLAHKYQVEPVRNMIVSHFENEWPSTLEEWDEMEDNLASIRENAPQGMAVDDLCPEPASVIQLAIECKVPAILPAAI